MKRQPTEWENIYGNNATDKGLLSKVYKQLIQFNIKKNKQPNQKLGRRSKETFLQIRHTDGQKAHKNMLNITKTTMRYHTTSVRRAIIKKSTINARVGVEKREPSYTVGGNVNWYNHYGERYGGSLKN